MSQSTGKSDTRELSKRERQVMDIVYAHGAATVADVQAELVDSPSLAATRMLLQRLHKKGVLEASQDGPRYLYSPRVAKVRAARSAVGRLLQTFFDGSRSKAMTALLGNPDEITDEELEHLEALVRDARQRRHKP